MALSISSLVSRVNEAIKNGWSPIGGLVVHRDTFYQAVTKPNQLNEIIEKL